MTGMLHLDIALQLGSHTLTAKADVPLAGITALEGPSGSGKTSLLRSIAGLEKQARGTIRFGDQVWQSDKQFLSARKRRIGFVFQDARLFKHLDVTANLTYGHQRSAAAPEVLQRVIQALDLAPLMRRQVSRLSGGEIQRVALGRALAMDPQLLLLDEPMSGLDQLRKDEILPYIARAVKATGCPAIYVSHARRETALLADQIMYMKNGQLSGPVRCHTTMKAVAQGGDGALFVDGVKTRLLAATKAAKEQSIRINTDSAILSLDDPGQSSALICLPVEIASITAQGPDNCQLVLVGQGWDIQLIKPASHCVAMGLKAGQKIWLNVIDAHVVQ